MAVLNGYLNCAMKQSLEDEGMSASIRKQSEEGFSKSFSSRGTDEMDEQTALPTAREALATDSLREYESKVK
jgi:hypothetical protein